MTEDDEARMRKIDEEAAAMSAPVAKRRAEAPPERFRMLPASDIAERGVVCCFMLAPSYVHVLAGERGITKAHFHSPAMGQIFGVLCSLVESLVAVDVLLLTQRLADLGILETVGGAAHIAELYGYLPSAANVAAYFTTLEEKATLRAIIETCGRSIEKAHDEQDDVAGVLAGLHERVTALTLKGTRDEKTFRQILRDTPTRWEETRQGLTGGQLYTGFAKLDSISPIRRKHTVVISGREKSGKSALAGAIVLNAAHACRIPTLVFPLEMPSEEWVDRLLSEHGTLSQTNIQSGTLTEDEMNRAGQAINELGNAPIDIFDSIMGLGKIIAKMRQWKAKHPTGGLCILDYLQLVEPDFVKGRNREQEVALMSKTMRNVGKELDIAVIELCQLNSAGEARESRAIQQDCTAFWQVLEDTDENHQVKKGREHFRTVHVKFQRHGPRNKRIPFTFHGDWMRFREEAEEDTAELFPEKTKHNYKSQHPDD